MLYLKKKIKKKVRRFRNYGGNSARKTSMFFLIWQTYRVEKTNLVWFLKSKNHVLIIIIGYYVIIIKIFEINYNQYKAVQH